MEVLKELEGIGQKVPIIRLLKLFWKLLLLLPSNHFFVVDLKYEKI